MRRPTEDRAGGVTVTDPVIAHRRIMVNEIQVAVPGDELTLERAQALGLVDGLGRPIGPPDPPLRLVDPPPLPSTGAGW